MRRRSPRALVAVVGALLVAVAGTSVVHAEPWPAPAENRSDRTLVREYAGRAATDPFTGHDGVLHDPAPTVVPGLDGELFYGPDLDIACAAGSNTLRSMQETSKLARLIAASGRRVLWTAGPSKTTVLARRLDPAALPHGDCDALGLAEQIEVIDDFPASDSRFVPLRKELARTNNQVYFKTDPHWTTVGATTFVLAVARALDPRLANRQRYRFGQETRLGLFNDILGVSSPETAVTARPATRVRVRTSARSTEGWTGYPATTLDHSWRTRPAKRAWPGRTLLLGDSFMLYALENMRPLFREGRFMFIGHVNDDDVIRAIKRSDTVVFEILQTFAVFDSILTNKSFRSKLRAALR